MTTPPLHHHHTPLLLLPLPPPPATAAPPAHLPLPMHRPPPSAPSGLTVLQPLRAHGHYCRCPQERQRPRPHPLKQPHAQCGEQPLQPEHSQDGPQLQIQLCCCSTRAVANSWGLTNLSSRALGRRDYAPQGRRPSRAASQQTPAKLCQSGEPSVTNESGKGVSESVGSVRLALRRSSPLHIHV